MLISSLVGVLSWRVLFFVLASSARKIEPAMTGHLELDYHSKSMKRLDNHFLIPKEKFTKTP
jgi:hypothetical protein